MSDLGSCSVCGRLCSGGLCEESPCPSAWEHDEPRRESGPWQAFGCRADERGWTCMASDFRFDNDEQCTAQDAQRAKGEKS